MVCGDRPPKAMLLLEHQVQVREHPETHCQAASPLPQAQSECWTTPRIGHTAGSSGSSSHQLWEAAQGPAPEQGLKHSSELPWRSPTPSHAAPVQVVEPSKPDAPGRAAHLDLQDVSLVC